MSEPELSSYSEPGGFGYVLWWGFDGATEARLQRAIRCLAGRYAGSPFTPHVTIATDFAEPPRSLARSLALRLPVPFPVAAVVTRNERFRRLVLEARGASSLLAIRQALSAQVPRARVPQTPPHVSLLYSEVELGALQPTRDALEGRVPLTLELTAVLVVHCPSSDPRSWSVLGRYGAA